LFPEIIEKALSYSIAGRALDAQKLQLNYINPKDFAGGSYQAVDSAPYGGGHGMLMRFDVLDRVLEAEVQKLAGDRDALKVVYFSPRGLKIDQQVLQEVDQYLNVAKQAADSKSKSLILLCGRYEGLDERVIDKWVDLELTLGDFILSGGELAASVFLDALLRLQPQALGHDNSAVEESFDQSALLEFPQYTKARDVESKWMVPETLKSGHHQNIELWRWRKRLDLSFAFRPDLIAAHTGESIPEWAKELLKIYQNRLVQRKS